MNPPMMSKENLKQWWKTQDGYIGTESGWGIHWDGNSFIAGPKAQVVFFGIGGGAAVFGLLALLLKVVG